MADGIVCKQLADVMTKGSFSEYGEWQHSSSTRGQGTSDSMIGLEWEGDSLSDSLSNFASASQSDEGLCEKRCQVLLTQTLRSQSHQCERLQDD